MNTGNVPAEYSIQIGNLTGDDFDLTNLRLIRDANGNGRPDPGEAEIAPSDLISLQPNESIDLVIVGNVPTDAGADQSAQLQIVASSEAQGVQASNIDTVSTSPGTTLRITKAPIRQTAQPGDEVSFTISVQSLGSTAPEGILVTVNNAPQTLVILRDAIPANTTFVSASTPNAATLLYHRIGDALHTYTTTAPPADEIDAVALGFNPYPNDSVAQLSLRVLVGPQASGDIINQAFLFGIDPFTGERITPPSNPALISVPRVAPTVSFYTGGDWSNIARLTGQGNPLWVQGLAASCNANPTEIERITITLQSRLSGDRLVRTAIETGPNTGVFRIVPEVPTNSGPTVESDEILTVLTDDVVTARLSDCGNMGEAVAQILIDPVNVVFDSRTNQPIAGATVTRDRRRQRRGRRRPGARLRLRRRDAAQRHGCDGRGWPL
jgi:large repetitive protein